MEPTHIEIKRMMAFSHNSVDDGFLITPDHEKPGSVTINFLREKEGLESIEAMPPLEAYRPSACFCKYRTALFRCAACYKAYCGITCQKRDWKFHVFTCRIQGRPNSVDYLRFALRRYAPTNKQVPNTILVKQLFADDDLCYTFGFSKCLSNAEVNHLAYVFKQALHRYSSKAIQEWVDSQCLHQHLHQFVLWQYTRCEGQTNHTFQWYLEEGTLNRFQEPSVNGSYLHQQYSLLFTKTMLALPQPVAEWQKLPLKQAIVVQLYAKLFQAFNNIPTPLDQEWLAFGFCHCRTDLQRQQLRTAYLQLIATQVPLEQIASCLGPQELTRLMESKNVDVSALLAEGVSLGPPGQHEVATYRLVAEVHHALSGRFCPRFRRRECSRGLEFFKNESNISIESEILFGFHGTEAWERWQLLNFYAYLFSLPAFDIREMQAATEKRWSLDQAFVPTRI
ncbi:hypothetical protein FSARC_14186 [Fusarium sarcochroum]|uniref:MYND-type domain-containing protein n=1 Tax=Fusarium sarcochroum TaxID=1208366 RepID=A0A8H4WQF1_9HYPO|nr:hypothetical protein FSARC_14186 [Fusarium sarcochroum]